MEDADEVYSLILFACHASTKRQIRTVQIFLEREETNGYSSDTNLEKQNLSWPLGTWTPYFWDKAHR
ncbi:Hypothetical protein CINCED_3A000630 [Cinara cedri]|uniref:Uncharacterized protein n=1 Tax=Cinara cedri TaxID=506608 RepID=A0A5E4NL06_9HEMI|nr:Hypothetical protein CINCED_3A000630 [Cinara cedri]